MIEDKLCSLFLIICQMGQQLHEHGIRNGARIVFMKLLFALEKVDKLSTASNMGALEMMADFFQEIGDLDEHECVRTKIAMICSVPRHYNDLGKGIIELLSKAAKRAGVTLHGLFKSMFMTQKDNLLFQPRIPCNQLATQYSCSKISSMVASSHHSTENSAPALFNIEPLHIAATEGHEAALETWLKAGMDVDATDLHGHTALFNAAAHGRMGCCRILLEHGANPNKRNSHGATILGTAAEGGNVDIVELLVNKGADINPYFACCESSPLQEAIASSQPTLEIVVYLIEKRADITTPRYDDKNAIDLARDMGKTVLEGMLLHRQPWQRDNMEVFAPTINAQDYLNM